MITRRSFIKNASLCSAAMTLPSVMAYATRTNTGTHMSNPKISLAQWSLHRSFEKGLINPQDFASITKNDYGMDAVEYVAGFYADYATSEKFWGQMKTQSAEAGVTNLLIMVDGEGLLGDPNDAERKKAVENHYKWIHAAKIMGCHSIRVNAFGEGDRETLQASLIDGLGKLSEYGAQGEISILIENHGLHTSDAAFIANIIKTIDNPYLGTLPDFGNWCLNAEWGSTQNNKCTQVYDPLKGVSEFLPFAKGVSAKSYNFDEQGHETLLDYRKLLQTVKDAGYEGYIGIEYEGSELSEPEGIKATQALIEKVWKTLD